MKITVNSQKSLYDFIEYVRGEFDKHKHLKIDVKNGKQRTNTQNAALHLYCDMIASELNEQGITFEQFFKAGVEVPWSRDIVKDNIWRPVQKVICKCDSTTKPTTEQYQQIFDPINLKLSNWGISIPWPSKGSKNGV